MSAPEAREPLGTPWIEEVRSALVAADAHPQWDRAEYVAGQLVNFVCQRETAAERRGRAAGAAEERERVVQHLLRHAEVAEALVEGVPHDTRAVGLRAAVRLVEALS